MSIKQKTTKPLGFSAVNTIG